MNPQYRTTTSRKFIKCLKKLGFKVRYSVWDNTHMTYYESYDILHGNGFLILFSFGDVIFKYKDTTGTIEYTKDSNWKMCDVKNVFDIETVLVLYK